MNAPRVLATGGFDDLRSRQMRFLEEASRLGELTVLLWTDETIQALTGRPPKFPFAERLYFLNALRSVHHVAAAVGPHHPDALPSNADSVTWVDDEATANATRRTCADCLGIDYHVLRSDQLTGFPVPPPAPPTPGRKKIVATGCYDWFHSGHVRFCEELSAYGDLYVIVGHDANIRLLKGEGHPLLSQDERRYVVGSIRYVHQALVSSGHGWIDADPEIRRLQPDIYAVNEDGDKGGKREYCAKLGIEYLVLKRSPAPGLPRRTSTDLRGF